MLLRGIEGIRNRLVGAFRFPLLGPCRTLGQLPFVFEEIVEEVVAPLRRRLRPSDLGTAGDRILTDAAAELALPAEALIFARPPFRLRPDQRRIAGAMGLAEGVAAGDERNGLFIVHRHARK